MNINRCRCLASATLIMLLAVATTARAQKAYPAPKGVSIAPRDRQQISQKLKQLREAITKLRAKQTAPRRLADIAVYAKSAEWILRHNEFFSRQYARWTLEALETGLRRAGELNAGKPSWTNQTGSVIRGYVSKVDGSVQPYALSLPEKIDPQSIKQYPLYVKMHGRGASLNEIRFIHIHDGKPLAADQTWIQLDVFGRTNNAYRYSGETDIFEAIADVKRQFRIDERRIVLWGFSMGGAGAWHMGLHHPSLWCSVGPGAGFIDFYKYQNQTKRRPPWQHKTLRIYDSVDYVGNAFNVPIIAYCGEDDPQLGPARRMVDLAKKSGATIKLLVGPKTGHRFHPQQYKEFMAFHRARVKTGRPVYPAPRQVRFTTWTLKYNTCDWVTVEEMRELYQPAVVIARVDKDSSTLHVNTTNVAVLRVSRDVAETINIDGTVLRLGTAARGLLPGVYFELSGKHWETLDYDTSRTFVTNPDLRKRHDLQGPIDDAFMQPFVCVRGTGTPWSAANTDWANWTLNRFEKEFDKWLRGRIRIVKDTEVTARMIADHNLILFGDPGSNTLLAKVLDRLPITWTRESFKVNGKQYDPNTHGLSLIYPNPLNRRRYVVVNSGHTFHTRDFRASNSWLFPRLGDIAVQKFAKKSSGSYQENTVWADLFDSSWKLPAATGK